MWFELCQTWYLSCPFMPRGTQHVACDKRSMYCTWFAHDYAQTTRAYMLETARSTVRRLWKISNCAFQCDHYYSYYLLHDAWTLSNQETATLTEAVHHLVYFCVHDKLRLLLHISFSSDYDHLNKTLIEVEEGDVKITWCKILLLSSDISWVGWKTGVWHGLYHFVFCIVVVAALQFIYIILAEFGFITLCNVIGLYA